MTLEIYNKLKQPPKEALRTIQGGRLKGKTDINPQWRYKAMTEQFGVCGVGWKYKVVRVWSEPANDNQIFAFAEVNVYVKIDEWSAPIPGYGGSMLVEKESAGLHASDEGYKMAVTDALSAAMKMLGVAADVYAGLWDGIKYKDGVESTATAVRDTAKKTTPNKFPVKWLKDSMDKLQEAGEKSWSKENVLSYLKTTYNITGETITEVIGKLTDSQAKAFIAEVNSSLKGIIEEH